MINIDGIDYHAQWEKDTFNVTAEILNGKNSGRLQGGKASMYLDPLATFFNFSGTLIRSSDCSNAEWDELFMALSNPINSHTVTVPFNQTTMTTEIYVSSVSRTLQRKTNHNIWLPKIEVKFISMESQWLAGGDFNG